MSKDIVKKDSGLPEKIVSELDLSEDELENDYSQESRIYSDLNALGYTNFDANGNDSVSESEREEMIEKLEVKFSEIMDILRINRNDPNSTHTPSRLAKMYVNELLIGRYTEAPKLTVFQIEKKLMS